MWVVSTCDFHLNGTLHKKNPREKWTNELPSAWFSKPIWKDQKKFQILVLHMWRSRCCECFVSSIFHACLCPCWKASFFGVDFNTSKSYTAPVSSRSICYGPPMAELSNQHIWYQRKTSMVLFLVLASTWYQSICSCDISTVRKLKYKFLSIFILIIEYLFLIFNFSFQIF